MKEQIPSGTPIGEIEAPLTWLLSHTARFLGVILVRLYTGDGFIIVSHGRPAAFFFRMGSNELKGPAAREFLAGQESMNASLRRYTPEEFEAALDIASGEGIPVERGFKPAGVREPAGEVTTEVAVGSGVEEKVAQKSPADEPSREITIDAMLDRILGYPGVDSVSFFREGKIVVSRGKISLEGVVQPAEDILLSAAEIMVLLPTGPLVQVTITVPGNSVTIAPFRDGYFLIMTREGVNIGQVRKLVSGIAQSGKE